MDQVWNCTAESAAHMKHAHGAVVVVEVHDPLWGVTIPLLVPAKMDLAFVAGLVQCFTGEATCCLHHRGKPQSARTRLRTLAKGRDTVQLNLRPSPTPPTVQLAARRSGERRHNARVEADEATREAYAKGRELLRGTLGDDATRAADNVWAHVATD